jgi:hypothetical protein
MKFVFTLLLAIFISFTASAQLVINEVCYDPSNTALEGDANGDGIYVQEQDEFIEFVNAGSTPLNLGGYQILDSVIATGVATVRHTFASNVVIPAGGSLVIFGGGVPVGSFGGAVVVVDTGSAGLSMQTSGEIILVANASGSRILSFNTDELSNNPNESYTRSPDITGAFVQHATLPNALKFSPGTLTTGQPFVLSTKSQFKANLLKVWPNPAKDKLFLDGSINSDTEIAVYNQIGMLVFKGKAIENQISLTGFKAGMYSLTATVKGQKVSAQFVVSQ